VRADVFLVLPLRAASSSLFFLRSPARYPLRYTPSRENEWTLYPGLNLKHGRKRRSESPAALGIISPAIAMLRSGFSAKTGYSPMEIKRSVR
jgi:hypothetical protein